MTYRRMGFGLLFVGLVASTSGCIAAAAAAGAAGAVAYSDRGAKSQVPTPVNTLLKATEAVFSERGITIIERKTAESGAAVQLKGKTGETEVTVDIDQDNPPTTKIEVTAKKNLVDYDRDYARDILQRILQRAS